MKIPEKYHGWNMNAEHLEISLKKFCNYNSFKEEYYEYNLITGWEYYPDYEFQDKIQDAIGVMIFWTRKGHSFNLIVPVNSNEDIKEVLTLIQKHYQFIYDNEIRKLNEFLEKI
ncbi:MAG: hypothetical protein LBV03_00730 [Fusobacteriales bacterium]|nr:hypothetical protein [Fusobacteriales bacterium]